MKILLLVVSFCLLLAGSAFSADVSKDVPAAVTQAASLGLKKFLPVLDSPQMKETHGFAGNDDLKKVVLGKPFEVFLLTDEAIQKYQGGKITEVLTKSGTWYFPVNSNGKLACFLSVDKQTDGTFAPDSMGMAELARVWSNVNEAWPSTKNNHPLLVIVPSRQRFFFTVPEASFPNLTGLSIQTADQPRSFYEKLTRAEESFSALRNQSPPPGTTPP